jgi:hypothetical protein
VQTSTSRPPPTTTTPCTHACTQISAYALELYNEDLLDLALSSGRAEAGGKGWDSKAQGQGLKLQERPVGKEGRVVPEVRAFLSSLAPSLSSSTPLPLHYLSPCLLYFPLSRFFLSPIFLAHTPPPPSHPSHTHTHTHTRPPTGGRHHRDQVRHRGRPLQILQRLHGEPQHQQHQAQRPLLALARHPDHHAQPHHGGRAERGRRRPEGQGQDAGVLLQAAPRRPGRCGKGGRV